MKLEQTHTSSKLKYTPTTPIFPQAALGEEKPYIYWVKKNWYYHTYLRNFFYAMIPEHTRVLHINCKTGYILSHIKPLYGVGIDTDPTTIAYAQEQYPELHFFQGTLQTVPLSGTFDIIILSFVTMEVEDIQHELQQLHQYCHAGTRVIIQTYNQLWEPLLWITKKLNIRRPTCFKNWIPRSALLNVLTLSSFDQITAGRSLLIPMYIPFISWFFNRVVAHIPGINRLTLHEWIVVRPLARTFKTPSSLKVSVIVPCRNEAGNINAAVSRIPHMGAETEIIFVEGGSTDQTKNVIEQAIQDNPEKNIRLFTQSGKGKADAVRVGYEHAQGDIVMILDGDLTMPPEELPKFFDALVVGKGECINGSRLVYAMESQAMSFSALCANWGFGKLLSWLMGQRVSDTLCGTKVLWKKDLERIFEQRSFFGLYDPFGDFDLLFGAARLNLKIIDLPIHYKSRTYGASNIQRWKDVWLLLAMSWKALIRFKLR
jgi:SAM-dependent methyltransferase